MVAKDADAGCFDDGDEDLVRGKHPGTVIRSVALDGAVKPLFNPPVAASPAYLVKSAELVSMLLSAR